MESDSYNVLDVYFINSLGRIRTRIRYRVGFRIYLDVVFLYQQNKTDGHAHGMNLAIRVIKVKH